MLIKLFQLLSWYVLNFWRIFEAAFCISVRLCSIYVLEYFHSRHFTFVIHD